MDGYDILVILYEFDEKALTNAASWKKHRQWTKCPEDMRFGISSG